MARTKNQTQKRDKLLRAAEKAITDHGLVNLTLAAVADKAQMSPNALLYYYPNLTALLADVLQQAVDRFCSARSDAIANIKGPKERLEKMLQMGLPSGPDDQLCKLLYELSSLARIEPTYEARYITLFERQVMIYLGILEVGAALGTFHLRGPSLEIARTLVILEDGLGLHLVSRVSAVSRAEGLTMLRDYALTATGQKTKPGKNVEQEK